MDWNEELLKKNLAGKFIGHKTYYYQEIGSTNDESYRLGIAGEPEGTVVISDSQTKGKGRMQRVWHSPSGTNIYTSILLRPDIPASAAPQLALVTGVAVAELLERYCPGIVELKWPNDVLINGKKACGILAEMKNIGSKVDFIIIGMGINVNINSAQFPPEFRFQAISISEETGKEISRLELIIGLYDSLTKWYKEYLQSGFNAVREKWLSIAPMIGKDIQVIYMDETVTGKAVSIDDQGALIVCTRKGETIKITAGDTTILKRII
jgi:BirA family biotin operon repressor/biotin-[acetyl-CoA-carboxylase] ligase